MEDLYRALPKLLRTAGDAEEVAQAATFVAWRRIAGETLHSCAVPFRLYRKTLVVSVLDATWQKQLEPMRWNMIGRINAMLEQTILTNIEFRVDPKTVRDARPEVAPTAREITEREQAIETSARELQRAAAAIADTDLRERFLRAAGSCLNAQGK